VGVVVELGVARLRVSGPAGERKSDGGDIWGRPVRIHSWASSFEDYGLE
jgi:hypothetical protein